MLGSLRILLLQARHTGDPCRAEEVETFAVRCGLERHQVVPWDLLEAAPGLDDVRRHDALMVGGSGDFYISRGDLPSQEPLFDLLREIAAVGHPTFASCFGFQCLTAALGGEVVHDAPATEVGTYELELTGEGLADPLFSTLPKRFPAQLGRKDRAAQLPPDAPNLASSERCPFQAFRLRGRPIWASQFHPELDRRRNLERYRNYLDGYATVMSDTEREDALARFDESPETERLLPTFLELVFG